MFAAAFAFLRIDTDEMVGVEMCTPWRCGAAVGQMCRRGMRGFFYGNGGMRVAWAWR